MSESQQVYGQQIPEPKKQPLTFTGKQKVLAVVAGVIVIAVLTWIAISVILPTEGMKQDAAYEACTEDARSQLRDPDSAQFELNPVELDSKDGKTPYGFDGHVRSRNGFGGMTSNTMMCIGKWDDDKGEADMSAVLLPSR